MPAPVRPGVLVTLEGIDGTGKSSVTAEIGRWLEREGVKAALQREPTPTWLGESVKRAHVEHLSPLALTFLFIADRAQHVAWLRDQVAMGAVVVCDRYMDSTVAYQGAALAGTAGVPATDILKWVRSLHDPWVVVPDLTLLIVDDPVRCMERVKAHRGRTSMFEDAAFLAKVQDNYRHIAAREPTRFRILEGGELADLKRLACQAVGDFLKARGLMGAPKTA